MNYRWRGLVILLLICLFGAPFTASAQTAGIATITLPKTEAFPRIETYLTVRDAQGRFVRGLGIKNVRIFEDTRLITATEITENHPGVQAVVAINPGPAFASRNQQGIVRYETLLNDLKSWAKSRQGSTLDDWSLLITKGPGISHAHNPLDWLSQLGAAQVDVRNTIPSLDTLSQAVDLASDGSDRPGMGKAILFFTHPMEDQFGSSVKSLVDRANQQGVHIFVWLISLSGTPYHDSTTQLTELARLTGGQFFAYNADETLDPETILAPLRSVYSLAYNTRVSNSNAHHLVVEVNSPAGQFVTSPQTFKLAVEPPNPVFISPVLEIVRRQEEKASEPKPGEIASFQPNQQTFKILIDFPDSLVRSLTRTTLTVDGKIVAENTQPPFDTFTWDLTPYQTSSDHTLVAGVQDSLGLTGSSIETNVHIQVVTLAPNPLDAITKRMPILIGIVVIVTGSITLLVLVVKGTIRPRSFGVNRRTRKNNPVEQPALTRSIAPTHRLSNWTKGFQWPHRQAAPKTLALLTRLSESNSFSTAPPIPIMADEITLGCDPNLVRLVLDDPSVENLHARLICTPGGNFRLIDEGSTAGTWINYTPVPPEGATLEHGDLIHIGRVGFRFSLRQTEAVHKPVIILEEPNQEEK